MLLTYLFKKQIFKSYPRILLTMPKKKKAAVDQPETAEEKTEKQPIKGVFNKAYVIAENSDEARELYNTSRYGSLLENGRVQLSLIEAAYLTQKKTLQILSATNREIDFESFVKKATRFEPNFWTRYCVYKDIRNRGYIIKTALKFGADFRVYDRGVKPGEDHAKWIVYPVQESSTLTWYEFSAKNRVAHSTKKRLLIAALDAENYITYFLIQLSSP